MNFVDRIFVGELTNTIMCEECEHVSVHVSEEARLSVMTSLEHRDAQGRQKLTFFCFRH